MSDHHPAWNGILEPGETILWQGAPDGGFRYQLEHPISVVLGLGMVAISTPNLPLLVADRNPMIIFPLAVLCVGLYSLIGKHIYDAWQRRGTYYTLTNRRAFIGSRDYKGKTLDSYPITPQNRIRLKETTPPSVYFAQITKTRGDHSKTVDVGFRYINDHTSLLDHLRTIQSGATP